jgi:nucleoside 2-deoxyribosyltransferase
MKVFISYSTAADQIVALRLQTLAAVSIEGVIVNVPPASTRHAANGVLRADVTQQIAESDVVLAVMIHDPVPGAVAEMNLAISLKKPLIPLVSRSVSPAYLAPFPHFFQLDPNNPQIAEAEIVDYLANLPRPGSNRPLLALCTLALGMILLSAGADSR